MKHPKLLQLALSLYASAFCPAYTQQVSELSDEELVWPSPFEVSSSASVRYQAAEASAGGRIAANIMDTPTTVTVLTRDFLNDVGGVRVLDAVK